MNPSILPRLVIEMRELGIKSLALELSDNPGSPAIAYPSDDRAALAPDVPDPDAEQKAPNQCIYPGCTDERRGLFGGIASDHCRTHALQKAGVRT